MNINNIEYEKILWVFVLFIAYLDLHSTYIGLSSGLVEQNPMGRYIIHTFGFIGLSIFKLFIIGFCYKLSKKINVWELDIFNAINFIYFMGLCYLNKYILYN